jgi:muconolactone delta-isomerase
LQAGFRAAELHAADLLGAFEKVAQVFRRSGHYKEYGSIGKERLP